MGRLSFGYNPMNLRLRQYHGATRKGFLTAKQYDDLGALCLKKGVWMRAMMEVGAAYGWRSEEVISLCVNQTDLVDKCTHLWPDETKNDDGREPRLRTLLCSRCWRIASKASHRMILSSHGQWITHSMAVP
jgi:integrase